MDLQQVSPNGQEMTPQPGFFRLTMTAIGTNYFNGGTQNIRCLNLLGAFKVAITHQGNPFTIDGIHPMQQMPPPTRYRPPPLFPFSTDTRDMLLL